MLTESLHAANETIDSAKNSTASALGAAKDGISAAKESTLQTVTSVISMVLKGVTTTVGIIATLKKLDSDDGLAWLGLSRRKSPLITVAVLGGGVAAGASLVLLLAPSAKAELVGAFRRLTKGASAAIETTETPATEGAVKGEPVAAVTSAVYS